METKQQKETVKVSFTLNGKPVFVHVSPVMRAVDLLRGELKLTGTKISCGIGRCGTCSVLLNGNLAVSCLLLVYQLEGMNITTIEGVASEGELHPIQQAFLEEGGFQCGYCTPGMILAVKALVDANPNPNQKEIEEALAGNICRCTGYGGIIRSIQRVVSP